MRKKKYIFKFPENHFPRESRFFHVVESWKNRQKTHKTGKEIRQRNSTKISRNPNIQHLVFGILFNNREVPTWAQRKEI